MPRFIAQRFVQSLAEDNADIFNRVMGIDLQVSLGANIEIDQLWRDRRSSM